MICLTPPRYYDTTAARGFTLIELSIVLVVIGLIVGGILVGQDLIEGAKARSQMSQIEEYTTATNTFRLKYNCLPGDCRNAVNLGLGSNTSYHNGNADKLIDLDAFRKQVVNTNNRAKESMNFFMHLATAGLIDGDFEGFQNEAHGSQLNNTLVNAKYPKAKYGEASYVFVSQFVVSPSMWYNPHTARNAGQGFSVVVFDSDFKQAIPKYAAQQIDTKMDDGKGYTGSVGYLHGRSITGGAWDTWVAASSSHGGHSCAQDNYINTDSTSTCEDKVRMGFYHRF